MPDFQKVDVAGLSYIYAEGASGMDPKDISQAMGNCFQTVFGFLQSAGITPAGPAVSIYYDFDPGQMTFRSGVVVTPDDAAKASGKVKSDDIPAGRALHFIHKGSYATLRNGYADMMAHVEAKALKIVPPAWEVYLNEPSDTAEEDLVTEVYCILA